MRRLATLLGLILILCTALAVGGGGASASAPPLGFSDGGDGPLGPPGQVYCNYYATLPPTGLEHTHVCGYDYWNKMVATVTGMNGNGCVEFGFHTADFSSEQYLTKCSNGTYTIYSSGGYKVPYVDNETTGNVTFSTQVTR